MKTEELQAITKVIRERRSVPPLKMNGKKIEKSIVLSILENANFAPNHGRTQPWRFFIFSEESKTKLANFQSDLYKSKNEGNFDNSKYEKLKQMPLHASHVIGIALKRQDSQKIPFLEEVEAVACAVQNMQLTAKANNVSAFWSTGGVTYYPETKLEFGLNDNDHFLGFLYLGYSDESLPEFNRKPIEDLIEWI